MTLGLLILIAWLALLQWGQPPRDTVYWNTLFDAGHAAGFALVTWALERVLRQRLPALPEARRLMVAALSAIALGVATEAMQVFDPRRHASLGDLGRDLAGIVAFLCGWRLANGPALTAARSAMLIATLLAAGIWPFVPWLTSLGPYRERDAAFPVVAAFAEDWESAFVTTNGATLAPAADDTGTAARLSLAAGRYSGIYVDEPYPDWRAFDRLEFEVELRAARPVSLVLRVHDDRHTGIESDRFNRTIELGPGRQHVSIPLAEIAAGPSGRRLDLSAVRGLAIFAKSLSSPVEVVLTPLRLQPKT